MTIFKTYSKIPFLFIKLEKLGSLKKKNYEYYKVMKVGINLRYRDSCVTKRSFTVQRNVCFQQEVTLIKKKLGNITTKSCYNFLGGEEKVYQRFSYNNTCFIY